MQNRLPHTRSTQWMFVKWNYRLNFLNNYRGIEESDVSPCHACIHFLLLHLVTELLASRHIAAHWQTILSSFAGLVTTFGPKEREEKRCTQRLGPAGHWEMVAEALGAAFFNLEMEATCWGGERVQAWERGWAHGLEPSAPKTTCFILDFYLREKQAAILLKTLYRGVV